MSGFWKELTSAMGSGPPEDRVGDRRAFRFTRTYTVKTAVGNYHAQYRLHGDLIIDNSERQTPIRYINQEERDKLVDFFNGNVLEWKTNTSFLSWGWTYLTSEEGLVPWLWLYRFAEGNETPEIDVNQIKLVDSIGEFDLGSLSGTKRGCYIRLIMIDLGLWDPKLVEENYQMMTKSMLELAKQDTRYLLSVESAAVAAMQKRKAIWDDLQTAQRDQSFDTCSFAIKTFGLEREQKIVWSKKRDFQDGRYVVLGYRREGAFAADPWSETDNGVLIAASYQEGETVEHLKDATSYFYTFFTKDMKTNRKYDWVRFSLRIPSEAERARQLRETIEVRDLEARLSRLQQQQQQQPSRPRDPRWEKWQRDKAFLGAQMKMKEELVLLRKQAIEGTIASASYKTAKEKEREDWLKWVNDRFDRMEEEVEEMDAGI